MVYRRSLPLATRRLQITASTLGNRAGLIGMALLLADTIFAPERVEAFLTEEPHATPVRRDVDGAPVNSGSRLRATAQRHVRGEL